DDRLGHPGGEGRVDLQRLAHEGRLGQRRVDEETVAVDVLVHHRHVGGPRGGAGAALARRRVAAPGGRAVVVAGRAGVVVAGAAPVGRRGGAVVSGGGVGRVPAAGRTRVVAPAASQRRDHGDDERALLHRTSDHARTSLV